MRAISLLLRIQNADDHSRLALYHTYAVTEQSSEMHTSRGKVRTRTYTPSGASNPSAMVVVHGVHHLGVDEPRLVAFSRALCATGIKVFTPELPDIADYRVSHASVDIIGEAAHQFARTMDRRVGVLGLSFAGGEALLAAADARFAPDISFVVSIGAHEDMRRVAEFFVTGQIARPDGTIVKMKPHEYGPLVLMYSDLHGFFPADQIHQAQQALRLYLWEDVPKSRQAAQPLSASARETMNKIYGHDVAALDPLLLASIKEHQAEMAAVSPHGQLTSLRAPVLLLHGAGDDVIPATELLWLEKDVPEDYLRGALTTPLLTHVSIAGEPPLREKLALVHFMAELMKLADESKAQSLQAQN